MKKYFEPTPRKWRIVGDLLLAIIPVVNIAIVNAPNISDTTEYWLCQLCTIGLILGKFATNFATNSVNQNSGDE